MKLILLLCIVFIISTSVLFLTFRGKGEEEITTPKNKPLDELNILTGSSKSGIEIVGGENSGSYYVDSLSCNKSDGIWLHTHLGKHKCKCDFSLFGKKCNRVAYDDTYKCLGNIDKTKINLDIISEQNVSNLSFVHNSCTSLCNDEDNCVGVHYEDKVCTLFSKISIEGTITYSHSVDGNLYMKGNNKVIIIDRVFITKGKLPLRYYLKDRYSTKDGLDITWAIYQMTQYKIHFTPTFIINDPNWIGVYSNNPINLDNILQIISNGTTADYFVSYTLDGLPIWKITYLVYVEITP
ncbi:MAG: hypothetical protein COA94_08335 [Rickettsiales bacterium]|nr:MAG: hypothetical protein COA94_08335 [Rickettsiales bacterium]